MQTVQEAIISRRSIRRYRKDTVSEETLGNVLEAVQWAPSWANTQCWEIVVIRDSAVKQKLQSVLSPKNPASLAMVTAPVVLAVCGREKTSGFYKGEAVTRFGDWLLFDLGLATQNILLSAAAQGLGTVVVGAFDHDRAGSILELPEGVCVATLVPLGYPDHAPGPPRRKAVDEFTHSDSF